MRIRLILILALLIFIPSCSISNPPNADSPTPLADFNGTFAGSATSNDGRMVKIAFDIQQNGSKFSGTYRCSAGNANCRNQISKGWVSGTTDARNFRVSLQDTSWCLYSLGTFYQNQGEGEYTCYVGASIVEQGTFDIKRVESQ